MIRVIRMLNLQHTAAVVLLLAISPIAASSQDSYYVFPKNNPATSGIADGRHDEIEEKQARGYDALAVMNQHLQSRDFFVGPSCTIADIALYAYTHVADEGGFDLTPYPSVNAWLDRVAALPRYVPITQG